MVGCIVLFAQLQQVLSFGGVRLGGLGYDTFYETLFLHFGKGIRLFLTRMLY